MKTIQWEYTSYKGVRFYKHETRRYGVKYDRYFSGSFQVNKIRKNIGFGWASEGWTEKNVWEKLNQYKYNTKNGSGPTSLKEEAALNLVQKEELQNKNDPNNSENITFAHFYTHFYRPAAKSSKNKETTVPKEKSYFNVWLLPSVGDLKFSEITNIHFENLKTDLLNKGRAPRTLQQCFALFDKVWNHAKKYKYVNMNSPTKTVDRPRIENKCTRFYTQEEATMLLNKLKEKSQQVHDMTLLSLHTGARRGEIFNLIWGVVDFNNMSVELRDAKGKPRHAFLTDQVYEMLKGRYQGQAQSDLVFTNINGDKYTEIPRSFNTAIKGLGFNKGVTDRRDMATFHSCRHTFASWHVQDGTDIYEVSELMGHSTIQLTERYAHLKKDGLKSAARRFNNMVKK